MCSSKPIVPRPDLPAVILAGGRATRMGGGDKGLRLLAGRPILAHVIDRLAPQCGPLALNANGDPHRFAAMGLPVLPDPLDGRPGPLAGVLAAMGWAADRGATQVVTVAADTPFLPHDLVARLLATPAGPGPVIAAVEDRGRLMLQPTFGLWPVDLRADLRATLEAGLRRAGLWAEQRGAAVAVFPAARIPPFFNINTPEDLETAECLLSGGRPGGRTP